MIIEVDKHQLLKGLLIADSIVTSKQVNSALANCLIKVDMGEITIISTDNEIGIRTRLDAHTNDPFSFTVQGKKFISILREIPDGIIVLNVDEQYRIDIKTKSASLKGHYALIGKSSDDFPEISVFTDEESITVPQAILKESIRRILYAAAIDTLKPVFNGMYIEFEKPNRLIVVASDSRRLSMSKVIIDQIMLLDKGIIIPLKTVQEIFRLLQSSGDCRFFIGHNQCFFKIGQTEIISRLLNGEYPNYKQVIPQEKKLTVSVNRDKILAALRRASIFTKEPANKIAMIFNGPVLTIEAKTHDLGECEEEIDIESTSSEEIAFGVNVHFVIEAINEIQTEFIELGITGQMSPFTITSPNDKETIAVIMPIKLK